MRAEASWDLVTYRRNDKWCISSAINKFCNLGLYSILTAGIHQLDKCLQGHGDVRVLVFSVRKLQTPVPPPHIDGPMIKGTKGVQMCVNVEKSGPNTYSCNSHRTCTLVALVVPLVHSTRHYIVAVLLLKSPTLYIVFLMLY